MKTGTDPDSNVADEFGLISLSVAVCRLLRVQPAQLVGELDGFGIERQQAFELCDRRLWLPGLRVDLGQVLRRAPVALVNLGGAAQLGDGRAGGPGVGRGLAEQRPPQRCAVVGLVGDETRRLAEHLDRFVVAAGAQVIEADLVEGVGCAAGR